MSSLQEREFFHEGMREFQDEFDVGGSPTPSSAIENTILSGTTSGN
jgi:hypothetical protein